MLKAPSSHTPQVRSRLEYGPTRNHPALGCSSLCRYGPMGTGDGIALDSLHNRLILENQQLRRQLNALLQQRARDGQHPITNPNLEPIADLELPATNSMIPLREFAVPNALP